MTKFKIGDTIRCLKAYEGTFTVGKLYTVGGRFHEERDNGRVAIIEADHGRPDGWESNNFELADAKVEYIVAIKSTYGAAPSVKPYVHKTLFQANNEAKRLAEAHPGNEFAVYARVGAYKAQKPVALPIS